ncbi:hypothetical protein ACT3CD_03750 [Geofilum sp. OHC36d9]
MEKINTRLPELGKFKIAGINAHFENKHKAKSDYQDRLYYAATEY